MGKRGSLVLIGGAEDRNGRMEVLQRTWGINRADRVAVIPSASMYPSELGDSYYDTFRKIGAYDVCILDVREKRDTDRTDYLKKVDDCDLIFFTGGDQVKLAELFLGTTLLSRIKRRFNAGATVAGTSAGAAVMSNPLIFDGDGQGMVKGTVRYTEGFGFVKNLTIDTHFMARERIPRLTQFLLGGLSNRGLGIDEDTAAIIGPHNKMEVFGSGMVTTINTKKCTFSNYQNIRHYDSIVTNGSNIGFLQHGTVFNLQYWRILTDGLSTDNYLIK